MPFLALPLELRDEIIDEVIQSRSSAPLNRVTEQPERGAFDDVDYQSTYATQGAGHVQDHLAYRLNAVGLLLTNRQLQSETMNRLRRHGLKYSLDLMW
ncbi:hypothetical protein K469DRAFT_702519 [Zopfia rhizophila CBS 207.26]|uniref:Uncharacterized protein n=1 Tax=Zopfia rhizophila CBS 207.26 TaxID=1314779 RepID=A0A6A6ECN7_9PEZI|nr:hypothetical protein K469DRAFT_702519 [Zopfia rhizophila CBS 207.26]